jgi:amidase
VRIADCVARVNSVELTTATIPQLGSALRRHEVTSVLLIRAYARRMRAFDHGAVPINAIRTLTADALAQARASDRRRKAHKLLGPLDGIPILLKDNIDTTDAATTAGSIALAANRPPRDATLVKRLRAAGAVILAKTNMSEFAYWMDPAMPEGYSSLGGQVVNPYNRGYPSGSSSGSGAAEAMSYGAAAVGTDTSGSIIGPANVESLVAVRPTVGLISRTGIIPLAPTWDTAGPMTRNVTDAAVMLRVLGGRDPRDRVFDEAPGRPRCALDYLHALKRTALRGARLGYSPAELAAMPADERFVMTRALADLRRAGATLVATNRLSTVRAVGFRAIAAFANEFKYAINRYLAGYARRRLPVHDLAGLIAYNRQHPTPIRYGQRSLLASEATAGNYNLPSAVATRLRAIRASRAAIDQVIVGDRLSAYLAPGTDYDGVAAAAQYPLVTVPMGFVAGSTPVGLGFVGRAWSERRLLALAYAYEQGTRRRRSPTSVNASLRRSGCRS